MSKLHKAYQCGEGGRSRNENYGNLMLRTLVDGDHYPPERFIKHIDRVFLPFLIQRRIANSAHGADLPHPIKALAVSNR
jgi:hypothetical protein